MLIALLVRSASSEGAVDRPQKAKVSGLGVKNNHANRVLPFRALGIDTTGEGKPLPPSGIWELFVAGKLKMKQPLPQTLRQRQAMALSNVAAVAGMAPFPGPLLSPPQQEWVSNMGATTLLVSPERVLQEIDAHLHARGQPRSRSVVNIGAAVLQTRNNGTWSGDGLQEYCHRLYEHGYNGPAYDPSAEGLRRLGERYPAVSLHQGFVTPVNVVSLLQEYHEGVAAAAAARASSAAAAVEPSGAVVSLEEEVVILIIS